MRPILSLNNTACPVVRVPEFPMVLPSPGNETYFEFFKSFLHLNDTDRCIVPSFDFLVDPENLIYFFRGPLHFWIIISGLIVWQLSMTSHA